jgi:hypothetical protein
MHRQRKYDTFFGVKWSLFNHKEERNPVFAGKWMELKDIIVR